MKGTLLWRYRVALTCAALMIFSIHLVSTGVRPGDPAARPASMLIELMGRSTEVFGDVLSRAIRAIAASPPTVAGSVYRFEQDE